MVITFVKPPTSPLDFEPLETRPEDILYPGSDQEYDYDDDKRAKKKLRVEILGRQYLEGRPLFIQSAGLRGPFEDGWVNPWAREKRKRGTNDTKRRLETADDEEENHTVGLEVGKGDSTVKRRHPGDISNGIVNGDSEKATSVAKRSPVRANHTAKRRKRDSVDESRHDDEVERPVKTGPAASNNSKNHWLKSDHAYLQAGSRSSRRSPTPTAATKSRTRPVTLPPPEKAQHRRASSRTTPDAQRIGVYSGGFTPINPRPKSKDGGIQSETTAEPPRQDPKQIEASTIGSPKIRVEEKDLRSADERTRHAHEEVQRLSQEAVERAVKEDGYLQYPQAKIESQEAASRAYHSKLEPYVSGFVVTDHATSSAGLKAASRVPKPSPHAAPPSTNLPEFRYRYTRKCSSSGSSRDGNPVVTGVEPVQKRARSGPSSSSDSEAFAQELEAAQIKAAAAKSFGSSHSSSSPAVEGHETNSIKKNTQALRRLTFTPSGGAKLAKSRTSSSPSSNTAAAGQAKSKTGVHEGNGLVRKESTRSFDLGISDGTRSRDSLMLPEAQVVPNAPIQLAQARSDPSTNLFETDKRSINLPSFDEGDSYLNLSTQAAFVKAQRSFKDDLYSLKSSPLQEKAGKTRTAASRYTAPDVTPLAKGGRAHGTTRRQTAKAEENDDEEEALSTQAMVDAMSPFAITTIKKRPPPLQKRTSFAPSPTKQQSPTGNPASALSPTINAFRRTSLSMSTSTSPSQHSPSPKSPPPPARSNSNPHTPSKPPTSTLTSFSILPNGTLTETSIYQDGQQLPQQHELDWDTSLPLDPFGLTSTAEGPKSSSGNDRTSGNKQPSSLDLNAVLEDAGSFLGEWDVEAEARREGRREREKERGEGRRGILVDKGGSL
ncbi:hypothetical protein JMJ35_005169 [Cladonia borealis]|uniref:Uncharacterized protein n=1 Tax=Cladonia borealis TaxID=184061 RepID=A0AA39R0Y0_9LECA|nr:hypothetical protein JMJ35_005169 [Cladonia borealis]